MWAGATLLAAYSIGLGLAVPRQPGSRCERVGGALGWVKRHFPAIVVGSSLVLGAFGLLLMFDELSRLTGDLQRALTDAHLDWIVNLGMIPDHTAEVLAALDPDLAARLRFVLEADSLKFVLRRNSITDGSRRENSGEHSWHLALMAIVLAPHSAEPVDLGRVVEMLLVHDLVEIDAGDTFVYDTEAAAKKEALEQRAADRLFALIPGDVGLRLACTLGRVRGARPLPSPDLRTASTASRRCS